jgi:CHAT domain-containing protein
VRGCGRHGILVAIFTVLLAGVAAAADRSPVAGAQGWTTQVGMFANRLAAAFEQGDIREALMALRDEPEQIKATYGPDHPATVRAHEVAAEGYLHLDMFLQAGAHARLAVAAIERTRGAGAAELVEPLRYLVAAQAGAGDVAAAATAERAVSVAERTTAAGTPGHARALREAARLAAARGDAAGARRRAERAVALARTALGPRDLEVALALDVLADALLARPDARGATVVVEVERALAESLAIKEAVLGPTDPLLAPTLIRLGAIARDRADVAEAERRLLQAVPLMARRPATESTQLMFEIAVLETRKQRFDWVLRACKAMRQSASHGLYGHFLQASERERLRASRTIERQHDVCLSFVQQHQPHDSDAAAMGLETAMWRKGMVMDAQVRLLRLARQSPTGRSVLDAVNGLRAQLSRRAMDRAAKPAELAALEELIEWGERTLATEVAPKSYTPEPEVTAAAVAKALPAGTALVEFVRHPDYDFAQAAWRGTTRYVAFVVLPTGVVRFVDLGEATALERLVGEALAAVRAGDTAADSAALRQEAVASTRALAALHARLWAPLEPLLEGARPVVLSPDGLLNLVPFAALTHTDGQPVIARHALAYVTSGRDLTAPTTILPGELDLLLVAAPAFDDRLPPDGTLKEAATRAAGFDLTFEPLPGAAREARDIPRLVPGRPERKVVLTGAAATEQAVKEAKSPRILHLATHGFFLPDTAGVGAEDPLVRSGLALAGANHARERPTGDDGILTALEIAGLDLSGTELAVLSACETGVGQVQTGEGVFGLRRAVTIAGARMLLMSLWPVEDALTAEQMRFLYQSLRSRPAAEALQHAQLQTIERLTDLYGTAPPRLWAPFILQGARALRK